MNKILFCPHYDGKTLLFARGGTLLIEFVLCYIFQGLFTPLHNLYHSNTYNALYTFTDPDSDPFSVLESWDWNLNLTPCIMKSSAWYNVAIWFAV